MKLKPQGARLFVARTFAIFSTIFLLSACSDDNNGSRSQQTNVRIIHAVPDAPAVNVEFNDTIRLSELDYSQSSGFFSLSPDTYDIDVSAIVPGDNPDVIEIDRLNLGTGEDTTVFAVGTVDLSDDLALEAVAVPDSSASPSSEQVSVVIVHAATVAEDVDIYVTGPDVADSSLGPLLPAATLDYKNYADAGALPVASYRIRITAALPEATPISSDDILFDSGSVDLSSFAGEKIMVAALSTTTQTESEASPVKLLAFNRDSQLPLVDSGTLAGAKVVHLSPDAGTVVGPVEVFATIDSTTLELIDTFGYLDVVPNNNEYVQVSAGTYSFFVSDDNDVNNPPADNFGLTNASLAAGSETTVLATGFVADSPAFDLIVSTDDNRPLATHAKVKVIHGAAAVGNVDIFVTPSFPAAGSITISEILEGDGEALLSDFAFNTVTDYVDLAEGAYDIRVVVDEAVAINVEDFDIEIGDVLTVIAYGPDGDGDPAAASLLVLSNNFSD